MSTIKLGRVPKGSIVTGVTVTTGTAWLSAMPTTATTNTFVTHALATAINLWTLRSRINSGRPILHSEQLDHDAHKWIEWKKNTKGIYEASAVDPVFRDGTFLHWRNNIGTIYVMPERSKPRSLPFRAPSKALLRDITQATKRGADREAIARLLNVHFMPMYGGVPSQAALYLLQGVNRPVVPLWMDEGRLGPNKNMVRDKTFAALKAYGLLQDVPGRETLAQYTSRTARTSMLGLELLKVAGEKNKDFQRFVDAYATEKAKRKTVRIWVEKVFDA